MAKLNGVKTVDMVNGEITKVAYEGAEYAAIETFGEAKKGDLLYSKNYDSTYVSKESYYEIIGNTGGSVRFIDNYRENGYNVEATVVKAFRKISAVEQTKLTLEHRVDILESDVATLKSGGEKKYVEFAEGNFVKVIADTSSWGSTEYSGYHIEGQGVVAFDSIGKVVKIDGEFAVVEFPEDTDYFVSPPGNRKLRFDEIELADETIEFEGAAYRKVDREAREGDVVIFTDDTTDRYFITKNKPYKTLSNGRFVDNDGDRMKIYANDSKQNRTRETVDVYEPIEYVPQEGDIVVIVKSEHGSRNSVGDIGKVTDVTPINFAVDVPQKPNARNVSGNKHEAYEVRKATPAEVEKYEQAVHKASFAVGDYVKIVKSYRCLEGNIAKITEIGEFRSDHGASEFKIEHLTGEYANQTLVADAEQLVKITPEEAKWAKINRKPNEFKKGDVVLVTTKNFEHNVGDIRIISKCKVGGVFDFALVGVGFIDAKNIELVAPVESKFNA